MSSISPLITFKAGICEVDQSSKPYKIHPSPTPGYIYLYVEDELCHFCWRPRDAPLGEPELDLIMIPGDGNFVPYDTLNPAETSSKTNGRIFALKFESSSARYLFWLQSKPQGRRGNPAWLSPRDRKIGEIVNKLLQDEEVDVNRELASVTNNNDDDDEARHDDNDETMEDVEGTGDSNEHHEGGNGGAGPDATGGDFRKEGSGAREGGADGARAASSDPAALVRNLLDSLKGGGQAGGSGQPQGKIYPMLTDLLDTSTTTCMVDHCHDKLVDRLVTFLPPTVVVLAHQGADSGPSLTKEATPAEAAAAQAAMSYPRKRALLKKVLRSPQFFQALDSLSLALREGGLPSIAEAMGLKVENGGYVRGGTMPLGGGEAIEAFVNGVRRVMEGPK